MSNHSLQRFFNDIKTQIQSGIIIANIAEQYRVNDKTIASLLNANGTNVTKLREEVGMSKYGRDASNDEACIKALQAIKGGMTIPDAAKSCGITQYDVKAYLVTKRIRVIDLRSPVAKNKAVHTGGKFHGLYTRDELLEMIAEYPTRKAAFNALKLPGTYPKMLQYLVDSERRELRNGQRLDPAVTIPAWRQKVARSSWFGGNLCL
jgi:hypothetical protein